MISVQFCRFVHAVRSVMKQAPNFSYVHQIISDSRNSFTGDISGSLEKNILVRPNKSPSRYAVIES